jgi:hypothetical protein
MPVNDRTLDRRGRWKRTSPDGAYRGTAIRARARGSALVLKGVRARHLALVASTCSRCGKVAVYRGGKRLAVLDLGRPSARHVVLKVKRFGRVVGPFTIRIKVLSRGKPVMIEGLGVSRT